MAASRESGEIPNVPRWDEVRGALETIVPTMEHVTVNLVAKALATRFNVHMDDIKACYNGLLFRFLHRSSAARSFTGSEPSDALDVRTAERSHDAAPKTHQPTKSGSSPGGRARTGWIEIEHSDGDDIEWEIEVAPEVQDDRMKRNKPREDGVGGKKKQAVKTKVAAEQRRKVKATTPPSSSSPSKPPAPKRPRLQTSATRAVADQPKIPPPKGQATKCETSTVAGLKRQLRLSQLKSPREAKLNVDSKATRKHLSEKKGSNKIKRGLANLIGMAKAIGIFGPNSALSRCVKQSASEAAKCGLLQKALNAHGHHFERMYPTRAEIARAKAAFETQRELDGIETFNILKEGTRRRRAILYQEDGYDEDSSGSDAVGRYGHVDSDGEEKGQSSDEAEPSDDSLE